MFWGPRMWATIGGAGDHRWPAWLSVGYRSSRPNAIRSTIAPTGLPPTADHNLGSRPAYAPCQCCSATGFGHPFATRAALLAGSKPVRRGGRLGRACRGYALQALGLLLVGLLAAWVL